MFWYFRRLIFTPFLYFFAAASNECFGWLGKTHNTSFSPARYRITSCRLHSNLHGSRELGDQRVVVQRQLSKSRNVTACSVHRPNHLTVTVKPGFHYPSWRPELMGVKNAPEFTGRQLGPWTRAVNSGSGNRPVGYNALYLFVVRT